MMWHLTWHLVDRSSRCHVSSVCTVTNGVKILTNIGYICRKN
ncbi:hypothetical protein LINPERPRIM_LOCUS19364 [Linum perenne]